MHQQHNMNMVTMMDPDHCIAALIQWVEDPQQLSTRHAAAHLANLFTALGGCQQLHNFLYNNSNHPFLGAHYLSKITHLLKHNGISLQASLQAYMEEFAATAGYKNVPSYEQEQPTVTRSLKYGFGEPNDQKGNDNDIDIQKALGNAFAALSKKAKQAATATGKNKKCGQSIYFLLLSYALLNYLITY
jgi:hypothetical protein